MEPGFDSGQLVPEPVGLNSAHKPFALPGLGFAEAGLQAGVSFVEGLSPGGCWLLTAGSWSG